MTTLYKYLKKNKIAGLMSEAEGFGLASAHACVKIGNPHGEDKDVLIKEVTWKRNYIQSVQLYGIFISLLMTLGKKKAEEIP